MKIFPRILITMMVPALLLAPAIALAQAPPPPPPQEPASVVRQDDPARDAANLAASALPPQVAAGSIGSLAGEYSYGNGLDMNCTLEISADGRFVYKRCNCEQVIEQAQGIVSLDNGELRLQTETPPKFWPDGSSDRLVPVAWGQRLYLVPGNDLAGFSNHVNRGTEPVTRGSMGSYFLREGDWDRPAPGKPDLPGDWKSRLLDHPLTGQVAGKDPANRWIINLGKDHRVYDKMELTAWGPDLQHYVNLRVTETGTSTSAVEIVGKHQQAPLQGWTVYSRIVPPGKNAK